MLSLHIYYTKLKSNPDNIYKYPDIYLRMSIFYKHYLIYYNIKRHYF